MWVFIAFGDSWCVEIRPGASLLGRDRACAIQLADDSVSQRHLRLVLDPRKRRVTGEDLGSTNGTMLNGKPLDHRHPLADGDLLLVGRTLCTIHLLHEGDPRLAPLQQRSHPRRDAPAATEAPQMRTERRRDPRIKTRVMVRLTCGRESFVATSHDVSLGGMFVVSEENRAPGPCHLTFLPEDMPPLMARGQVRHVIAGSAHDGHPPGVGIKFTEMEQRTWSWIEAQLTYREESSLFGDTSSL